MIRGRTQTIAVIVSDKRRVDGITLSPSGGPPELARNLLRRGVPLVQADRRIEDLAPGGYVLARRLLERRPRPTTLFIAKNLMTVGALLGLKEAGVRIPEEMAGGGV